MILKLARFSNRSSLSNISLAFEEIFDSNDILNFDKIKGILLIFVDILNRHFADTEK